MWYNEFGKDGDVVLSSRVRLARNLDGVPFPLAANEKQQEFLINAGVRFLTKAIIRLKSLI